MIVPPQLSVAVGSVHAAVWLQFALPTPVFTVKFDGQPAITGIVLSTTVTSNEHVKLLFPAASVAT